MRRPPCLTVLGHDTSLGEAMRGRLRTLGLSWALGIAAGSCGPTRDPFTPIDQLAKDVHDDEVAAIAKYRDEPVSVRGKVYQKRLKGISAAQGEDQRNGKWSVQMGKQYYAYLLLGSEQGGSGRVVCFFPPESLEDLVEVKEGDVVIAHCGFAGIGGKKKVRNPVLNGCVVERP